LAPTHVPRVGRDLTNYAGEHAFISPLARRAYTNLDPAEAARGRIKQKRWTVDANHFREMAGQSGHGLLRLTMCGTTCHNARPGRVSRWRCPSVYIPGFRMPNIHNRFVAEMGGITSFFYRGLHFHDVDPAPVARKGLPTASGNRAALQWSPGASPARGRGRCRCGIYLLVAAEGYAREGTMLGRTQDSFEWYA
jgi:hypothetical protein